MCEPRPHRPPRPADDAAQQLHADVAAGRLDAEAVDAVVSAVGHAVPRRREGPAGLTPREVEVLRLLALGLSNREIGARLVITPKTAGNHIEHIYSKIGASSRVRSQPVRDAARAAAGDADRRVSGARDGLGSRA